MVQHFYKNSGLLFSQKNSIINVRLDSKYTSVVFLWISFNYLKATEPLRGDSLLFATQSPGVPDTHLIDLGRMKR